MSAGLGPVWPSWDQFGVLTVNTGRGGGVCCQYNVGGQRGLHGGSSSPFVPSKTRPLVCPVTTPILIPLISARFGSFWAENGCLQSPSRG